MLLTWRDRHDRPGGCQAPQRARAQTRNALGDLGANTRVGQVGCGEGCEPLLHHLVIHDDDASLWVVAGLMMDWAGLPARSSAGIGHSDGLRRRALRLQERVG